MLSITKCVLHLLSVFTSTDSFSHWFMMWQAESTDVETEAQSVIDLPRATNTKCASHGSNARLSHSILQHLPQVFPATCLWLRTSFLPGILLQEAWERHSARCPSWKPNPCSIREDQGRERGAWSPGCLRMSLSPERWRPHLGKPCFQVAQEGEIQHQAPLSTAQRPYQHWPTELPLIIVYLCYPIH